MYANHPEDDLRALQIASIRCSLRRTLKMASEFVHLVEIYGRGSVRLMRILKKQALPHFVRDRLRGELRDAARIVKWVLGSPRNSLAILHRILLLLLVLKSLETVDPFLHHCPVVISKNYRLL